MNSILFVNIVSFSSISILLGHGKHKKIISYIYVLCFVENKWEDADEDITTRGRMRNRGNHIFAFVCSKHVVVRCLCQVRMEGGGLYFIHWLLRSILTGDIPKSYCCFLTLTCTKICRVCEKKLNLF